MLLKKLKLNKIASTVALAALATTAQAGYTVKLTDKDTITFGGYVKADMRTVDGDINSITDNYWVGLATRNDISRTKLSVNESRFNTKYVHGDITGFIELDFYDAGGSPGGAAGNEIVSNSYGPRLRHAFIKYQNVLVGQTWTTFMNTSALAEAADFGGPLVAAAFIRQGQVRYTNGGLQLALENPESDKGDNTQDSMPDLVAKYTFKGDWGNVSVAGLARQLNTVGGESENALGFGVAGRLKVGEKNDFRFQVHGGETGRYVGVVAARDLVGEKVEETQSYSVAYRHFWSDTVRSNFFYGNTTTDVADTDRTHWGVNVFNNLTPKLAVGFEIGNYEQSGKGDKAANLHGDSNYFQLSAKYAF
ncbi:DcaP family trimeric outer membrane transporter [Psychrobium sp. 1_MG-2023]|uniref:DcaP family trimeric outer membrane transporter n=1 Tax=Psychrobium sp. 1_MG-2023 TaxID=3062624 RepID=UPI000C323A36|nr:DcaP family trimeric outer membrane transporter [Psychrobium sp. 1_MG-2023]MDP2561660.1 DcaP family trimeric outer membrane transporter [Psychrobium sp. 1_MG-2023]PKF57065.1 hypothetical protein CW748_08215 [Alteromonadales bacterium alter-6D02]